MVGETVKKRVGKVAYFMQLFPHAILFSESLIS